MWFFMKWDIRKVKNNFLVISTGEFTLQMSKKIPILYLIVSQATVKPFYGIPIGFSLHWFHDSIWERLFWYTLSFRYFRGKWSNDVKAGNNNLLLYVRIIDINTKVRFWCSSIAVVSLFRNMKEIYLKCLTVEPMVC